MLNRVKDWITIISIIIAIISSAYGIYSKHHADKMQEARDNALDELAVKTTEVSTYVNSNGQLVTKTIEYEKTFEELKNSNDSIEKLLYASYKASKLQRNQIDKLIHINSQSSGGGLYSRIDTIYVSDSIEYIPVVKYFNDGYLDLIVYEDSIEYSYEDDLTIISAKRRVERDFFLWRWIGLKKVINKDMVEITSNNPRTINKVREVKVR